MKCGYKISPRTRLLTVSKSSMGVLPRDFFWGAATASYQVEGGIDNCDWAVAATEGRVPPCGIACDHYNRYESDFDVAVDLGHTAHRFSLEWARIEPKEGEFDMAAVAHYQAVIAALRARNLEPIMTLWHFTLPTWFAESGGFERKDAPQIFARYARFCAEQLGADVTHITTMNEPNVVGSNGWLRGSWPPFKRFSLTDMVAITNSGRSYESRAQKGLKNARMYWRVMKHMAEAHNEAYRAVKSVVPQAQVSVVKHVIVFDANGNPLNKLKAAIANYLWTGVFMNRTKRYMDIVGLNYYFYTQFGDRREWKKTDMDWNFAPEKIYDALRMLSAYGLPVFVSEAGLADHDDSDRAEYITKQVEATVRAVADGIDVRGHLYWSLMDNYEWALGFEKQFGLIKIHYDEDLRREIRPSAWIYKTLIEQHSS